LNIALLEVAARSLESYNSPWLSVTGVELMTLEYLSKEIEEQLSRFEEENPELVKTVKLMGLTIEEYNKIVMNMSAKEVVATNTSEG